MTLITVTYGYARAIKADDESKTVAGYLRLPGHPLGEQDLGDGVDPLRIHPAPGERHRRRQQRHRQDPRRSRSGLVRLPAGYVRGLHHRGSPGARTDGGTGRKKAAQPAAATGPARSADHRRVGLRPPATYRRRTAFRGVLPALRVGLHYGHHQPALRRMDRGLRLRKT